MPDFAGHSDSDPNYETEEPTTAQQLLETWKRGQKRLNQFWSLWKNDYLLSLRERTQKSGQRMNRSPQIGEVVLIKDSVPRSRWKVGKVVELFMGRDQRIRSAKVSVSPHSYLHRPVSLLYPIECPSKRDNVVDGGNEDMTKGTRSTENETNDSVPMEDNTEEAYSEETIDELISPVSSTRPIRKATIAAEKG